MEIKYHNIHQQTEFAQLSWEIIQLSSTLYGILVYFDIKFKSQSWFLILETAIDKTVSAQGQARPNTKLLCPYQLALPLHFACLGIVCPHS